MTTYAEHLRNAASIVTEKGVNLGGYPYEGGVDPLDVLRESAGPVAEHIWTEVQVERGMTTPSVVEAMREAADRLDRQDAIERRAQP